MRKLLASGLLCLWAIAASFAQDSYCNPIIPGFYPDPSICRVGDGYFLVNSSFHYFPAVPLWHSKDLVHWEQIGNVLDRASQVDLSGTNRGSGIYAPTIRYDDSDGTFYMVTTNVSHGGNFFVTTKDPWSGWSEPVFLEQGGIDPSFFFEDDCCYMLSNPDGCIWLCTIDRRTGKRLTPSRPIWKGTGGRYPEAPHIYRKDGWYYLLISEGGTEYGHMVTIARSRDIYGPYEANPANPILTHRDMSAQSNPIQATGHADMVQAPDGSWWMVCLGIRPQTGMNHLLGRETFLAPVRWDEGEWPVVNETGTIDLEMSVRLPAWHPIETAGVEGSVGLAGSAGSVGSVGSVGSAGSVGSVGSAGSVGSVGSAGSVGSVGSVGSAGSVGSVGYRQEFGSSPLGPEWVYVRNPRIENYETRPEGLALHGIAATLDATDESPTMVLHRQRAINCEVNASLSLSNAGKGDEAGLSVFLDAGKHYDIFLREDGDFRSLVLRYRLDHLTHIEKEVRVPDGCKVRLRICCTNDTYSFHYDVEEGCARHCTLGEGFQSMGTMDARYLSEEVQGGFTGCLFGLYCSSVQGTAVALFDSFSIDNR